MIRDEATRRFSEASRRRLAIRVSTRRRKPRILWAVMLGATIGCVIPVYTACWVALSAVDALAVSTPENFGLWLAQFIGALIVLVFWGAALYHLTRFTGDLYGRQ
jgi:ABC-type enterobactin transport system permease subunit